MLGRGSSVREARGPSSARCSGTLHSRPRPPGLWCRGLLRRERRFRDSGRTVIGRRPVRRGGTGCGRRSRGRSCRGSRGARSRRDGNSGGRAAAACAGGRRGGDGGGSACRFGAIAGRFRPADADAEFEPGAGDDARAQVGGRVHGQRFAVVVADADAAHRFADDLVHPGERASAGQRARPFGAEDLGEDLAAKEDDGAVLGGCDHTEGRWFRAATEDHPRQSPGDRGAGVLAVGLGFDRIQNQFRGIGFGEIHHRRPEACDQSRTSCDAHRRRGLAHPATSFSAPQRGPG